MYRINPTMILIPTVVYLLPLLGHPARLTYPGPWLGIAVTIAILGTQPKVPLTDMVRNTTDRRTGLGINLAVITGQVVSIADFGLRQSTLSPFATLGGVAIALIGLVLRLRAIQILGRSFTSLVRVRHEQPVISAGPYRHLRHPSYTGALMAWVGVSLALQSVAGVFTLLVLAIPAYLLRIRIEERALVGELGERYRQYATHTWRLMPFVY